MTKSKSTKRTATLRTPAPSRREVAHAVNEAHRRAVDNMRVASAPLPLANLGAALQVPPESELDREVNRLESCAANFVADALQLAERLQPVVRLSPGTSSETKPLATATSQLGGRLSDVSERLAAGREVIGRLLETLAV